MNKSYRGLISLLTESANAEPAEDTKMVNYSAMYKAWKKQKGNVHTSLPFANWQTTQEPSYVKLVKEMTLRRLQDKHYLSLEERADFRFCFATLYNKYYMEIPGMTRDEVYAAKDVFDTL